MKNRINITILSTLGTLGVYAQGAEAAANSGISTPLLWIIYIIVGLLLLITYVLYLISRELKRYVRGENETAEAIMYDNLSSWEKIFQLKPVGTDKDSPHR